MKQQCWNLLGYELKKNDAVKPEMVEIPIYCMNEAFNFYEGGLGWVCTSCGEPYNPDRKAQATATGPTSVFEAIAAKKQPKAKKNIVTKLTKGAVKAGVTVVKGAIDQAKKVTKKAARKKATKVVTAIVEDSLDA